MKKLFVLAILGAYTLNANAQADPIKELACKGFTDAVSKAESNTQHAKKGLKSATWVSLADAYIDHASKCGSDSSASIKAYETLKKALEIENASGGKKSKSIEEELVSDKLYSALMSQGATHYNTKNLKLASEMFELSGKVKPADSTSQLYAGIVNQSLGNNDGAIENFKKYLDNKGQDPAVFYSLAQIYKIEKKYDKAIEVLRKGTAVHPNDKDLKSEIINTYLTSNNLDAAIVDLEKMTISDPKNVTNLSNLGLLYDNKAQEFTNEISDIKEEVEKNNIQDFQKKLTNEKEKLAIFENELQNLTNNLKKYPKNAIETKRRIADVTSQKIAQEEAVAEAAKSLANKEAAQNGLAAKKEKMNELVAKQKGYKAKAFESYKKVLALDPDNYDVNFNMAVIHFNEAVETKKVIDAMDMQEYQKSGKDIEKKACTQFNIAKPFFDKCKSLNPNDEVVLENLVNLERILEQCKN
jgi:tetratricopeptide (TPR) repeat protein